MSYLHKVIHKPVPYYRKLLFHKNYSQSLNKWHAFSTLAVPKEDTSTPIQYVPEEPFTCFSKENFLPLIINAQTVGHVKQSQKFKVDPPCTSIVNVEDIKGFDICVRPFYTGYAFMTTKTTPIGVITIKNISFAPRIAYNQIYPAMKCRNTIYAKLKTMTKAMKLHKVKKSTDKSFDANTFPKLKTTIESILKWEIGRGNYVLKMHCDPLPMRKFPIDQDDPDLATMNENILNLKHTRLYGAKVYICSEAFTKSVNHLKLLYNLIDKTKETITKDEIGQRSSVQQNQFTQIIDPELYVEPQMFQPSIEKPQKIIWAVENSLKIPMIKVTKTGLITNSLKITQDDFIGK